MLDMAARTGIAVGGADDPEGYAAPILAQQFPGAGGVQAGSEFGAGCEAGSFAGAEYGRMVVPGADSSGGSMAAGNRAFGAGWNAQATAVAGVDVYAQALVVDDPGAARAGISAGVAPGMADACVNAAARIHVGKSGFVGGKAGERSLRRRLRTGYHTSRSRPMQTTA